MSRFRHTATAAALVVAIFALGSGVQHQSAQASEGGSLLGDADCSGSVDSQDTLSILGVQIGSSDAPCAHRADVQCDGDIDSGDALQILRFNGGLPTHHQPGCPEVGAVDGPEPDPIHVEATLDSGRTVTATIGADGGEITATGSDGATFVLSIPQGALAGVEEITLTPVLSVSNFPMSGGLIGAVFVGPQDLVLTELATLTIQTSAVADGWTLTSFGFHDGEVFLIPVFPEGASVSGADDVVVTLPTIGAGGVGVGAASEADAQLIVAHSPSDPVDLLRQRIADILHRSPNGPTPEVLAEAEQITQDFYVWNLRLVIGAAKVDCDAAWTLVHRFMWWLTPIQIGFTQTAFAAERAEVEIGIAAGMANCFEEAYLRCTRGGDRRVELARMLKAWGVVLAGIGPEELFRELVGSPEQKVTECFPCTALGRTTAMVPQVQDMSIGELPCGWRGTIEKSDTQNGEDWHRTFTITGELTWRRTPESFIPFECESVSPPCTVYFATGTIQWHYTYSIDRGDYHCDENRSGAFDVRQPSSEDWWQQSLRVSSTDAGIEYSGDGDYYEGDTPAQFISDCEGPQNIGPWLVTGDDPVVSPDAGVIEGSHLIPLSDPPGLVEYQWELTALPE